MGILVGYGVGPQTERVLRLYWEHPLIVTRLGKYCGTPFKGHQKVTQGYLLSPTIFNMVVGEVIHHWVVMSMVDEAGYEGFGWAVKYLVVLFYSDYRLLTLLRPSCLQAALDVLTGIFNMVGIKTNINNMVGIFCQLCCIADGNFEASYERIMTEVVTAKLAGPLPGVCGRLGGRVAGGTPPVSAWYGSGTPVVGNYSSTGPHSI